MYKNRRCHYFSLAGEPTYRQKNGRIGCPRDAAACLYAHPEDPEWDTAYHPLPPNSPPPRRYRSRSPRRGYRDSSPRHRRDSRTPPRRGRERDDSSHHPRSRDRSLARSATSFDSRRRLSPEDMSRRRPVDDSSGSRIHNNESKVFVSQSGVITTAVTSGSNIVRPPSGPRAMLPAMAGMSSAVPQGSSQRQPPLEPAHSAPNPRPIAASVPTEPVWRPIPSTDAPPPLPKKEEMTVEEKRVVWNERIALLSDVVSERMKAATIERDVQHYRRLIQSNRFEAFPAAEKTRTQTILKEAEIRLDEERKVTDQLVSRLVDTGFWPVLPPYDIPAFEDKYKDMKDSVEGLVDSIAQLQERMAKVTLQHQSRMAGTAGSSIGIDAEGPAKKRKRLFLPGDTPEEAHHVLSNDPNRDHESAEMEIAVDGLRDRIRSIDHRVLELDNSLTQHARDVISEFDNTLDEKIGEILTDPSTVAQAGDLVSPVVQQAIENLNKEVSEAGGDIQVIADEVAELIAQSGNMTKENARLQVGNEKLQMEITELRKVVQSQSDSCTDLTKRMAALQIALTKRLNAPLPPPPPLDLIIAALERPTVEMVHKELTPRLAKFRENVEDILHTQADDVRSALWPQLVQSMKMTQLIMAWIEGVDAQGVEHIRGRFHPEARPTDSLARGAP